jgi:MFS superfamily sulfate permease-like transporter
MYGEKTQMLGEVYEILKEQRLARSSAVIVGLILVVVAHAPVLPVVAGCVLAMAITVLRSSSRRKKDLAVRGDR